MAATQRPVRDVALNQTRPAHPPGTRFHPGSWWRSSIATSPRPCRFTANGLGARGHRGEGGLARRGVSHPREVADTLMRAAAGMA